MTDGWWRRNAWKRQRDFIILVEEKKKKIDGALMNEQTKRREKGNELFNSRNDSETHLKKIIIK